MIAILLLGALLISSGLAIADESWTSTADFDAGTKTSSGGNYEVETSSDNDGIATGAFELGSLKGDRFTFADTDANTFKWTPDTFTTGACSVNTQTIADGSLELNVDQTSGTCWGGVVAGATVSGDFDVRVQLNEVSTPDNHIARIHLLNEATLRYDSGTTADGVLYQENNLINDNTQAFTVTNGVATACGTGTLVSVDPKWWRIARSGTTWTWYYSSDGSAWTQDEQCTLSTSGGMYAALTAISGDPDLMTIEYDDFFVASGTVDSGGYRTSGSWTSATQTFVDEVVQTITVTYSGVSASNYIDAISVRDSAGNAIYTDDTDITSGTETTIVVPYTADLQVNWAVRIVLASGGAGTPTITQIDVTEVPPPADGGGGGGSGGIPISIECTQELLSLYCSAILSPLIAGITIERTVWFANEKPIGNGTGDGRIQRAVVPAYIFPRGILTIRLVTFFSNGQVLEKRQEIAVDNSWLVLIGLIGGIAGVVVIIGIAMSRRRPEPRSRSRRDYELWRRVFK